MRRSIANLNELGYGNQCLTLNVSLYDMTPGSERRAVMRVFRLFRRRLSVRWRRWGRPAPLALCLLGCLLLAACGVSTATGRDGQLASIHTTPSPTLTPSVSPTSPPAHGVILTVARSTYTRSSTITVTLTNGSAAAIYAYDHQTSCTILSLQRLVSSGWQTVGECALGVLTRQVEIHAGETMKISLAPGAGTIRAAPWPAGTYRAILRYTLNGQATDVGNTVTTDDFTVA